MSTYSIMLACLVYMGGSVDSGYRADVALAICLWGLAVLIAVAAIRSVLGVVKNTPQEKL